MPGFRDKELSALWSADPDEWQVQEYSAGLFSHCLHAERVGRVLMRSVFDAVIVGAGPAGSSAAILLARAGWSVALVEKQRFPRRKVCGECIAASNLSLLDALGIGPVCLIQLPDQNYAKLR
jgi:heterodisulfide reductase subunit A-like polyferredoxin